MVPQKGFMKAFKAFIKLFETPQRSVKINILIFILIQISEMHGRQGLKFFIKIWKDAYCASFACHGLTVRYLITKRIP